MFSLSLIFFIFFFCVTSSALWSGYYSMNVGNEENGEKWVATQKTPHFLCSFFLLFSSNDAHRVFWWISLEIMFIQRLNQISPSKIYKWLLILFHFNLFPFAAVNNLRLKKMLTHYELVYILLDIFNGKVFQKDVDQIEYLFKFGFFLTELLYTLIISLRFFIHLKFIFGLSFNRERK